MKDVPRITIMILTSVFHLKNLTLFEKKLLQGFFSAEIVICIYSEMYLRSMDLIIALTEKN